MKKNFCAIFSDVESNITKMNDKSLKASLEVLQYNTEVYVYMHIIFINKNKIK